MKITSILILTLLFTYPMMAASQEADNKDFLFLGGTVGHVDILGRGSSNNDLTLGLEAVYMRKVWGKFAVGGGINYNFGLPAKTGGTEPSYLYNGETIPTRNYEMKRHFHDYNLSLLVGGIFDHNSGARTTLLFGPVYGGRTSIHKFESSYEGQNLSPEFSTLINKGSHTGSYLNLRLGGYHQFANSNWTVGLNATTKLERHNTEYKPYMEVRASLGYAF